MLFQDIDALGPNWYVVKVRSLSELRAEGTSDEEETGKSSHVLLGSVCKKSQKQSMSNLMAMFSSRAMRSSDLHAMLKTEDTGERVSSVSGEAYDGGGWLVEEFPLATISEESHVTSSSRSTTHSVISSRAATPISPEPSSSERKTPEPGKKSGKSRKALSVRRSGKVRVKRSGTRAPSPLALEPDAQQGEY